MNKNTLEHNWCERRQSMLAAWNSGARHEIDDIAERLVDKRSRHAARLRESSGRERSLAQHARRDAV